MNKFDPFLKAKSSSLLASRDAIFQLAHWLTEVKAKSSLNEAEKKDLFVFALKVIINFIVTFSP